MTPKDTRTESRRKKEGRKGRDKRKKRDKTKGVFVEKNIRKNNTTLPLISVKNGQSEHFSSFEKKKEVLFEVGAAFRTN